MDAPEPMPAPLPVVDARPGYSILGSHLTPIAEYLSDPAVSEVSLNEPGRAWIERIGSRHMIPVEVPEYTPDKLARIANAVASESNQHFSENTPLLSARIKAGGRIQIVGPPVSSSICFSIRQSVRRKFSLSDYKKIGYFDGVVTRDADALTPMDRELLQLHKSDDLETFFRKAVAYKRNIVVSGATSSGKTTFADGLLMEVDPHERIITIEDSRELDPPQENHLAMVASRGGQSRAQVDMVSLLEASLRLRPDRILLGELRGAEAFAYIRALNTGHGGSITTVHADTPAGALDQIALCVLQSGINLQFDAARAFVAKFIHIIVQCGFDQDGNRKLEAVHFAPGKPVTEADLQILGGEAPDDD